MKPGSQSSLDYERLVRPDFKELSADYPEFSQAWNKLRATQRKRSLDDSSQKTTKAFSTLLDYSFNVALTRALLHKHFHLTLPCMPEGQLCPPVPNRFHYVQWVRTLLEQMYLSGDQYFISKEVGPCRYKGLDIGCGASCIYPLLLSTDEFTGSFLRNNDDEQSTNRPVWKFFGTDIHEKSVQYARDNVSANRLEHLITVQLVEPTTSQQLSGKSPSNDTDPQSFNHENINRQGPIFASMMAAQSTLHPVVTGETKLTPFDFCMTNPPFYSTVQEATLPREGDGRKRTDMTSEEGVYPAGGEEAFVLDMIHDSIYFRNNISWYTAVLGKKSSLITIERKLIEEGFGRGSVRTTRFIQGNSTRWGVAWTFQPVSIRSPETQILPKAKDFLIRLAASWEDACVEVIRRIQSFMDEQHVTDTECEMLDPQHISYSRIQKYDKGDYCVSSIKDGSSNNIGIGLRKVLWTIDFSLSCPRTHEEAGFSHISVHLDCYSNFRSSDAIVESLVQKVEGDICRTNRRWRRQLDTR